MMRLLVSAFALLVALLAGAGPSAFSQQSTGPVQVKIHEAQTHVENVDVLLPVDPRLLAKPEFTGNMTYGLTIEGKRLTFSSGSAYTTVRMDGRIFRPTGQQMPLGPGPLGKARHGVKTTWVNGNVHLTQIMEIVPGKPSPKPAPGQKRRMDTLLIRYLIENKDTQPHTVGVRVYMDAYCWTTDGPIWISPLQPKQILNGVTLKGKDVPDYMMIPQNENVQNPGWVAYLTCRFGSGVEGPTRLVHTTHISDRDGWEVNVQPSNGDSDFAIFWDPVEIRPGGKREVAFAHGQGIASNPENEGRVTVALGGSFEPGKLFTITAYVDDAGPGQNLTLELPPGMERIEGKETQPVPSPSATGTSIVLWKARVLQTGTFAVKIRSSNGVTQTRTITITRPQAANTGPQDSTARSRNALPSPLAWRASLANIQRFLP